LKAGSLVKSDVARTLRLTTTRYALAEKLSQSSSDAMAQLKKVMWEGTENWDTLLVERAEMSGRLVLSDFTKKYIEKFKKRVK